MNLKTSMEIKSRIDYSVAKEDVFIGLQETRRMVVCLRLVARSRHVVRRSVRGLWPSSPASVRFSAFSRSLKMLQNIRGNNRVQVDIDSLLFIA